MATIPKDNIISITAKNIVVVMREAIPLFILSFLIISRVGFFCIKEY
jgi:hypothetical protein